MLSSARVFSHYFANSETLEREARVEIPSHPAERPGMWNSSSRLRAKSWRLRFSATTKNSDASHLADSLPCKPESPFTSSQPAMWL